MLLRIGELPAECLLAYYESRRRWLFGRSGITVRGLHVEGVNSEGGAHRIAKDCCLTQEPLIALAGVGCKTLNECSISKMGVYRDRLFFSRSPVVGTNSYSGGPSCTTSPNGASIWSVDDDVLPESFFNSEGDFEDSVQSRLQAKLSVSFGNPYKMKMGNRNVPKKFLHQKRPRQLKSSFDDAAPYGSQQHTLGSPPHSQGMGSPPHSLGSPPHGTHRFIFIAHLFLILSHCLVVRFIFCACGR